MGCNPDKVHDGAYDLLPDEEAEAFRGHIAACAACAALAEGYRREEAFLMSALAVGKSRGAGRRQFALALGFAACFVAAVVAWLAGVFEKRDDGLMRSSYRMKLEDVPPEARRSAAAETRGVILRRLAEVGLGAAKVDVENGDRLVIAVPPALEANLRDAGALVTRQGKLALYEAADRSTQERFVRDGQVLDEFRVWTHDQSLGGEYEVFKDRMLLRKVPVITGQHMATAAHRQQLSVGRGMEWIVAFELTREGAKRFDDAAKRLFSLNPRGIVAIVFDGRMISAPVMNAEYFGGSGIIEGNLDEKSARDLAIVLRSGGLPVPLEEEKELRKR